MILHGFIHRRVDHRMVPCRCRGVLLYHAECAGFVKMEISASGIFRVKPFQHRLCGDSPSADGGNVPRPAAGQEGRHQGFYPLNSHFLLGGSGADCRYVTASKKEYGRGFFLPQGSTVCSHIPTYSQCQIPFCYTYGLLCAERGITVPRKS